MAVQTLANNDASVTYLYCGNAYLSGSGLVNLQDGQHPTVQGYQDLGGCIEPTVAQFVGWSDVSSGNSSTSGRGSQGAHPELPMQQRPLTGICRSMTARSRALANPACMPRVRRRGQHQLLTDSGHENNPRLQMQGAAQLRSMAAMPVSLTDLRQSASVSGCGGLYTCHVHRLLWALTIIFLHGATLALGK